MHPCSFSNGGTINLILTLTLTLTLNTTAGYFEYARKVTYVYSDIRTVLAHKCVDESVTQMTDVSASVLQSRQLYEILCRRSR